MKLVGFLLVFIVGCSSVPETTKIPVPAKEATAELKDSLVNSDTLWVGEAKDTAGKVIATVAVSPTKKTAIVYIKPDTVIIIEKPSFANTILPTVVKELNWWETALLFGNMGLIMSLIIYLRIRRGKIA